jgi:quercetin dioxygenase-like cupin family protein
VRRAEAWTWNELPAEQSVNGMVRWAKIPAPDALTIGRVAIQPNFDSGDHAHGYDQWVIVLRGQATMTCGDEKFDLRPGSIMRIPAGSMHRMQCDEGYDGIEFGLGVEPSK